MSGESEWWLWAIGQAGLLLDIFGAGWLVIASFRARGEVMRLMPKVGAWANSNAARAMRDVFGKQPNDQLIGFGFLAVGLILQFIGGFGTH